MTAQEALDKVMQLKNATLPKEEWTHEMHLIVAMYVLLSYKHASWPVMKRWIWRYNESVGKGNDGTGYHATLTVFWLWRVRAFMQQHHIEAFTDEALDLLIFDEELTRRKMVEDYYDWFVLTSPAARRTFKFPNFDEMPGVEDFLACLPED